MSTSSCGPKPGLKATGTPIKLGTINTKQPGTDFTDGSNMAKPYFDCVNANGGINGHPIQYFIETEQTQPSQIAADAKQLVQTDHVLGMVGNFSVTFTNTPTMNLYKAILKQYGSAVSGGIGSFSQMGFTEAEIATHALEGVKGAYTVKSVNAAFKAVKDFNTGQLCQPWTTMVPMRCTSPTTSTTRLPPDNRKMEVAQGCTPISAADPQIAQIPQGRGWVAGQSRPATPAERPRSACGWDRWTARCCGLAAAIR